jgi:DNA polymerase-3 subunit epsilon
MLGGQPKPEQVMPRLQQFVRGLPIVAHNAAFDRGFLHAELARAGLKAESEFLCTMRLARRLAPGLPSYRLDTLLDALNVRDPNARQFHRSVADVNHTIAIWQNLYARFVEHTGLAEAPVSLLGILMRKPKKQVPNYLAALKARTTIARPNPSVRPAESQCHPLSANAPLSRQVCRADA